MSKSKLITKRYAAVAFGTLLLPVATVAAQQTDTSSSSSGSTSSQRQPGGALTIGATATATVKSIDPAKRTVTLESADGTARTIKCGKNVINFDQIKVGDQVRAMAMERMAVYVGKSAPPSDSAGQIVALAPKGAKPAVIIVDTDEVKAKIDAVDAAAHSVTLSSADGASEQVQVGPDVDLSSVKKGDDVVVRYTQGMAIMVAAPQQGGDSVKSPAGAGAAAAGADAAAAAQPAADAARAQPGDAPGDAGVGLIAGETATASVTAVDPATRTITLKTPDGKSKSIHLGKHVINFDQIKVGDQVRATLAEAVAVSVSKGGAAPSADEGAVVMLAPKGAKPGMLIADADDVTGKIRSVDAAKRSFILDEVDGSSRTIKVGPKVNLAELSEGDDITARCTQVLAIVVEKP